MGSIGAFAQGSLYPISAFLLAYAYGVRFEKFVIVFKIKFCYISNNCYNRIKSKSVVRVSE